MKDEPGTIQAVGSFLVGVAFLIAACSRPSSTADSSALKAIDQAALQNMVDTTAKELLVPSAVLLLRTPQDEFKVTYDTHFRIASNTKSMTAAVIVQLAQEGKLSLDDPVSKYVPGVPNGDNITIDELLKMRSGLYNYTDAPELAATVDRDPTKVWTTEEVLAIAFARRPTFRLVPPTNTTTPTTCFSASSPRRSMANHWLGRCRTGCSGRWGCTTLSSLLALRTPSPIPTPTGTCTAVPYLS
jgi:CubicO group peptidase (beta-lactamase class C family)